MSRLIDHLFCKAVTVGCKYRRTLSLHVRTVYKFLTSVLRHEERDNSYYADCTIWSHKRAAHLVVFKISVGRDRQNSNYMPRRERTQFSMPQWQTQLSACMVQSQILNFNCLCPHGPKSTPNWLFIKIFKFSGPSLPDMMSLTSRPFPIWGFIMTIGIVISFVRERKLDQCYSPELRVE